MWRCAGAVSPGPRYWIAPQSVVLVNGSPFKPGFASASTRLSPPRSIVMISPARRASGKIVSHFQSHGRVDGSGVSGMILRCRLQSAWRSCAASAPQNSS